MAKKTTPQSVKTYLLIPLDQAQERVYRQLEKGQEILNIEIRNEDELNQTKAKYSSWHGYTEELLKQLSNTDQIARKFAGGFEAVAIWARTPQLHEEIYDFHKIVQRGLERLASVYEQLELFPVATPETPKAEVSASPTTSSRSESVTINNYGTIYNPQIQQGTKNSSQEITSTQADIEVLLGKLTEAVKQMSLTLPEDVARQVQQDLLVLVGEARSNAARKEWWQLSADGLKKAAKNIGEIGSPVIELVSQIVPLLIAISSAK